MKTNADSALRIIVTGLIAQHPHLGGVTWDYLQYVVGFARLGHDVYYIEDSGEWPYMNDGVTSGRESLAASADTAITHLREVMRRYGLEERWAYRFPREDRWYGMADAQRSEVIGTADLLINVSGTIETPAGYQAIGRRVYIDSDPMFTQIKYFLDTEFAERLNSHTHFFTFGMSLSQVVPKTGHHWIPTRQPILMDEWYTPDPPAREAYTTVMNWTSYRPLVFEGDLYGQKDLEFRKFIQLPQAVDPIRLEVALSKTQHDYWETDGGWKGPAATYQKEHPDAAPAELLRVSGWTVVDADHACGDMDRYRNYIQTSKGEWSVAKQAYVAGDTGWFSCRSACYLAAGRPVVVEHTGFSRAIPVGEGILTFSTLEEAVDALKNVEANYCKHARQARALADALFNADNVLPALLEDIMRSSPRESEAAP